MNQLKMRFSDESGLAEGILVGVVAWAFAAVVMLTTILVTANQIDDTVAFIRTQTSPIDQDLDSVKLVEETNRLAKDIETAAKPLSGQLDHVLATTIRERAQSIDGTAGEINQVVKSINSTAAEINGSALSINGQVKTINGHVRSIHGNVNSINASVRSIGASFAGIDATVPVIRGDHKAEGLGGGLAGAARRVDVLNGLVAGLKADLGNILANVGSIEKSADSIENKRLRAIP